MCNSQQSPFNTILLFNIIHNITCSHMACVLFCCNKYLPTRFTSNAQLSLSFASFFVKHNETIQPLYPDFYTLGSSEYYLMYYYYLQEVCVA